MYYAVTWKRGTTTCFHMETTFAASLALVVAVPGAESMAIERVVRAGAVRAARQLHAPAPRPARQLHAPAVALSPVEQRSISRAPGQALSHENITLSKQDLGVVERQAQDPFNTYQPLSQVAGRCVLFVRATNSLFPCVCVCVCVHVCMCVSHA